MRETLANRTLTYGLLGLFVLMVAVPLFWMVTTAPFTRSTSGATVPGSAPEATAPGGGAASATTK